MRWFVGKIDHKILPILAQAIILKWEMSLYKVRTARDPVMVFRASDSGQSVMKQDPQKFCAFSRRPALICTVESLLLISGRERYLRRRT